ncbi:hypothetical protein DNTS_029250 [Danionella cerebrum]|uniref:HID1 domain-containing protein n=1 Tax=Danionella cerebrum TaxID=2873325 RepID=A0A553QTR7_9TELE|nr:hypothetical protein DNTS_029250 [Danionella translucida]
MQPVEATDDAFWDQFWADPATNVQDVFALVPAAEIRAVREESPSNLATLCYKVQHLHLKQPSLPLPVRVTGLPDRLCPSEGKHDEKLVAVEKLVQGAESGCPSEKDKQMVLNCSRMLTRILPYIFEDQDWRGFFWSTVPGTSRAAMEDLEEEEEDCGRPLAESLLLALADLLFCPDFTVHSHRRGRPDSLEDMQSLDSCEYIWEAGVGFAQSPPLNYVQDLNRAELLRLLLTCFSEAMYLPPSSDSSPLNPWVSFFCSAENRHALPLFTSLLNVVCAYDPVGYGIPYNHLLFSDHREQLVEQALQILIVTLDLEGRAPQQPSSPSASIEEQEVKTHTHTHTHRACPDQVLQISLGNKVHPSETDLVRAKGCVKEGGRKSRFCSTEVLAVCLTLCFSLDAQSAGPNNLFVNYLSRIHREEDYDFILKGLARLLTNPLTQTYLPNSTKKIQFHQELLVLFWKLCDFNKKFLFFVLKSSDVLDVLVPILYYLNDARADQSRVGLMHIGVFILLLLSGERNFGVRLNKPYSLHVPMDIPVFTGTHADLLVVRKQLPLTDHQSAPATPISTLPITLLDLGAVLQWNLGVFHKIITSGHQRLQPLYDCLLTIVVNVSPYLKSLSMVAANKLLHLLEAFSTNCFLFSAPQNHHLVFFLLEAFNNIIQYQFDGKSHRNCNLVYAIIRKRNVFQQLANVPTDTGSIQKALQKKKKSPDAISRSASQETVSMEGSHPAVPAEPGTLKASLMAMPGIDKLTEKSQVSEDGTMVAVPHTHSAQTPGEDQAADTESLGGRESEVR